VVASEPGKEHTTGHYMTVHVDGMFNFSNWVAGYKPNRFYSFIPYVGVGIGADYAENGIGIRPQKGNKSFVPVVGLLNQFSLSKTKNIALTIDISGQAVQSKWNDARFSTNTPQGESNFKRQDWDGIGSVNVGLTFGLGKKQTFDRYVPYVAPELDSSLIEDLQNQVNSLKSENDNLRNQLNDANSKLNQKTDEVEENVVVFNKSIMFDFGKATLTADAQRTLDEAANVIKSAKAGTTYLLVGSTDKKGSEQFNLGLSRQRAQAVARALESRGVSASQLKTMGIGERDATVPESASNAEREKDRKVEVKYMDAAEWEKLPKNS
jgi:outer membrane protein OmpA-like peptidoglycan-associated protein